MTLIAAAWMDLLESSHPQGSLEVARSLVAEHLVPENIDRDVLKRYVRKALRNGAWRRLRRESRALLWAAAKHLHKVKSPVLRDVLRGILLEIELSTLRGRAVFYGALLALRQGLTQVLGNLKRLITLGVGYLNLPTMWRVLG
ncbi:hypothetical protein IMZ38_01110 [Thermosphaera chiliense]|uniref:Uncharacterized protein n=1 Tax=Thermosphaera chiliense TaxID=3402707 RepID=A0A7M1UQP1_9CREN|nr:hypothetical protein [Thermosphaera aggregans]QOR94568.1 hypothetical protein IMZ38_01110 [Thermosphaera aggregans]